MRQNIYGGYTFRCGCSVRYTFRDGIGTLVFIVPAYGAGIVKLCCITVEHCMRMCFTWKKNEKYDVALQAQQVEGDFAVSNCGIMIKLQSSMAGKTMDFCSTPKPWNFSIFRLIHLQSVLSL